MARRNQNDAAGNSADDFGLEEREPWHAPVDGADMMSELKDAIERHVRLEPHAAEAVALWIVHAYLVHAALHSPRLAVTSPLPRCGKTTLLDVINELTPRPLQTANISTAGLFRTMDAMQPTLLIDEAETFLGKDDERRGIINAGHRRGGTVVRLIGDDYRPKLFNVFCPLAIACIGHLADTIADRSIVVRMRRALPDEKVVRLTPTARNQINAIARRVARWAQDNVNLVAEADPVLPDTLGSREADNWRPLVAIADACGPEWGTRARKAASALSGASQEPSTDEMLLADIKELFDDRGADRLRGQTIIDHLVELEARPWAEWNRGQPMKRSQLARRLSAYRIASKTIRFGTETAKGYYRRDFEDAWARYLPRESVTTSQLADTAAFSVSDVVDPRVTHVQESVTAERQRDTPAQSVTPNANDSAQCDDVTTSGGKAPWRGRV